VGVADWNVTPLGSVSVTVTPAALEGPALWTASVYVNSCPEDTGSGESDFVIERSATGSTVVVAPAVLLAGLGSLVLEDTVAVLVIGPVTWGVTLIWTLALAPLATDPSGQVTVPADCVQPLPWEGVAETNVTPAGSVSLRLTAAALEGPALLIPSVYVSSWPWSTGSGESDLVSERLAAGSTVVTALAELFAEDGSLTPDEALAVFVIEPVDWGVTLIWTLALAPFAIVPSGQLTVPAACVQLPCEGVAELNVTPAGRVSLSDTPVAVEGPPF
jgi:hypothetical protein